MGKPVVSLIIPTKNSSRTLEACLLSCKQQTYPHCEIIVVDNFSDDATVEIAKQYTQHVYQQGPERTAQKNFGIEKAQGEYIIFIDSDMELTIKVIEQCVDAIINNDAIGGICIPEHSIGNGMFVKIRNFERSFYKGTGVESARFFKLSDVKKVGGFEEDLIFFEESLLPQKIENQLSKSCKFIIDTHINHNENDIKLRLRLEKKFYYGESISDYSRKAKQLGIHLVYKNQLGIIYRYLIFLKNKRFYQKPLLAFGVLFLKTLEFGAGVLGLLYSKYK